MIKVFVIDDTASSLEPLGKAAGEDCEIYWLDDVVYQSSETIDKFVGRILTDSVWRGMPDRSMPAGHLTELAPTTDSVAIFVIHVHARVTVNSYRQSQDGVEVLKHIRLTEELGSLRTAHVVLCSFEDPVALLARKPGNLIILSKGTTVLRLPDSKRELEQHGYLTARADIKAEINPETFAPYVRCDYREVDRPHQFSNWWGLHRIAHARRLLKPDTQVATAEIAARNLGLLENKKTRFLLDHGIAETADGIDLTSLSGPESETNVVYVDDEGAWGGEHFQNALKKTLKISAFGTFHHPIGRRQIMMTP